MTASAIATEASDETWSRDAFGFVQKLAAELSEGQVQLPSYPEVALRVQRALADESASVGTIVRAISAEPALSMQVMRMANSVALNASGQQVHDLQAAVQRIGYSMVRAAALSFVMHQLRSTEGLEPLRQRLNDLWQRSVVAGTVCRCVANQTPAVPPDGALLAGLLHGVGKLYILTRLRHLPQLLEHPGVAEKIISDWHGNVARALLENWEMPEEFGNAVADSEDPSREHRGAANLTDALAAAHVLSEFVPEEPDQPVDEQALGEAFTQCERLFQRLGISHTQCLEVVRQSIPEARQMRSLFGA